MAENYTAAQAAKILHDGSNMEAIQDIVSRFPLFGYYVSQLNEAGMAIMTAFPEKITARKINFFLANDEEDLSEDGIAARAAKKAEKAEKRKAKKAAKKAAEAAEEEDDDEDEAEDADSNSDEDDEDEDEAPKKYKKAKKEKKSKKAKDADEDDDNDFDFE